MSRSTPNRRRLARGISLPLAIALLAAPEGAARAAETSAGDGKPIEEIVVVGSQPVTATSIQTVPSEDFELRPMESGGQMLEAIPNLLTAQHTGGGKAEQYFIRGFDADHGTDLAVYFDGVPVNLRSHAHGQGFVDLHFVTPETIDLLDAYKGPYLARFGDFSTAATVEYVPAVAFDESFVRAEGGEFDTFRTVAVLSPRTGPFDASGPARGFASFEAYHTNGPFNHDEDLWRYSALARGEVDLGPDLVLSGHLLGYHGDWDASGLIPKSLVRDGTISRWGSLDTSEGGKTTRVQGKAQLDWNATDNGKLSANAYLVYYDLKLFSNFTYYLVDPTNGDGIIQRDRDRIYTGGRIEYAYHPYAPFPVRLLGGVETRYDDARVVLGTQTRRRVTGTLSDDRIKELSVEPYFDAEITPLPWLTFQGGLRFAWFRFDGRDELDHEGLGVNQAARWLPKANLTARPFSDEGPLPVELEALRSLELFANFGLGYHSNDARAGFDDSSGNSLPRATGAEVGFRTHLLERVELAFDAWYLGLEDELVFVGDEGTTESAGKSTRLGIEVAMTAWLLDWLYVRGDFAYTSARLDKGNTPIAQAPRVVAKAATGVRYGGFAAELGMRHLGERYATEDDPNLRLRKYTVFDFGTRYRWGFLEAGIAVENITNAKWSSSEFYYESQPTPSGPASEDFHFSPGNPRNVRGWVTAYF